MYNIAVQRLPEDPKAQGVIQAQDHSWQLVIDKEGFPHLWVRAKLETGESGLVPIETFLPEGLGIRDIMLSEFGGELTDPNEIAEAQVDWEKTKSQLGLPEPK